MGHGADFASRSDRAKTAHLREKEEMRISNSALADAHSLPKSSAIYASSKGRTEGKRRQQRYRYEVGSYLSADLAPWQETMGPVIGSC
mmetsp:Transcript_23342/g.59510  ORF Transcript_23342/g.59510 Transcript_23342/m.59510 type:complete len:88 (+) Transcript_23342:751-1014(+)